MEDNFSFGFSAETKAENRIPIDVPHKDENGTWVFPLVYLSAVTFDGEYSTKKGKRKVLIFDFSDIKGEQSHRHIEWDFDPATDKKAAKKIEALNTKLAHMYKTFRPLPQTAIGSKAKTIEGYFKAVVKAFNEDMDGKPIFRTADTKPIVFWLKLIYNNGNRNLPYSPNFMHAYKEGIKCNLDVNQNYDDVENLSGNMANLGGGSKLGGGVSNSAALGNLPTFDE